MHKELLRTLRKCSAPVTLEYLEKELNRDKKDIENAIIRMKKLITYDNGLVSLK